MVRSSNHPSPSGEGPGVGAIVLVLRPPHAPTPTQQGVNSTPCCSGHAGGMTDPLLLKGRGFENAGFEGFSC